MNREQRRMLKKQGQEVNDAGQIVDTKPASGDGGKTRADRKAAATRDRQEVRERTSPIQFTKEVRSELRKVNWPTRTEVLNYSVVVLITVILLTIFIGLLDWLFSVSILELFKP